MIRSTKDLPIYSTVTGRKLTLVYIEEYSRPVHNAKSGIKTDMYNFDLLDKLDEDGACSCEDSMCCDKFDSPMEGVQLPRGAVDKFVKLHGLKMVESDEYYVFKPIRCTRCLYDDSIEGITFDADGMCSYCHIHDQFCEEYPTGSEGVMRLSEIINKIKHDGRGKDYDVIVGFSGGCDSSYMLKLAVEWGLRPLAVHWDNSFNTEIAEQNMKNVTKKLGVKLYTYQVDPEEMADINLSFLKAGVSDVDIPNDIALTTVLYRAAEKYDIKYIFNGHSFRTEGIAPLNWTYMDGKYIESVHKQYGNLPMKTFPNLWMKDFIRWTLKGIKRIRPLYYVDYNKEEVKEMLAKELGWKWYGGHHLENKYTAFVCNDYLPDRFDVDCRVLGYSGLIRSGQMKRIDAELELAKSPASKDSDVEEIRKRLDITKNAMHSYLDSVLRWSHEDFKTYHSFFKRTRPFWWLMYKLNRIPKSFYLKYTK